MLKPYRLTPTKGTIRDDKIPCRETAVNTLLNILISQSVTLEEIRRMGKTLLLQKLVYLCNNNLLLEEFSEHNFKAIYFSFQGKQNLGEVIDLLLQKLKEHKNWHDFDLTKTYNLVRNLLGSVKVKSDDVELSVNLPVLERNWKEIFFKTLDDVSAKLEKSNSKLILIFDEMPIMLWDWYKDGRHQEVIEFLDILRERRQELEKRGLRFIYSGSIGIKVILQTLKSKLKYTGEPTNDMDEFNLKPFSFEESKFLMECFVLSGFTIKEDVKGEVFEKIHTLCNGLPFYISQIFLIIQSEFQKDLNIDSVNKSYILILNDPIYQKAFNQLKDRLEIYYEEKSPLMTKVLSILAKSKSPLEEIKILSQLGNEDEEIKTTLYTLYEDNYLNRTLTKDVRKYSFKYQIFKDWWRINKA